MKGLLKKELYLMAGPGGMLTVLSLVFAVAAGCGEEMESLGVMAMCYASLTAFSNYSAEEQWRCANYILCMPVTRGQVVRAKYIVTLAHFVVTALVYAGTNLVFRGGAELQTILIGIAVGAVLGSVSLPLVFWLGSVKGRIAAVSVTVFLAMALGVTLSVNPSAAVTAWMDSKAAYMVIPGASLLLFCLSCPLAACLYRRRIN